MSGSDTTRCETFVLKINPDVKRPGSKSSNATGSGTKCTGVKSQGSKCPGPKWPGAICLCSKRVDAKRPGPKHTG